MGEFINLKERCREAGLLESAENTIKNIYPNVDLNNVKIGVIREARMVPYVMAFIPTESGETSMVSTGITMEQLC